MKPLLVLALATAFAFSAPPVFAAAIIAAAPAAAPAALPPASPEQGPARVPPAIPSASSAVIITLGTTGDFERKVVHYGCDGATEPLQVDYINAAPNYLAIVPIDGATLVFNTVLSASGARYAAGKYVWSTKGGGADLFDLTQGANAKPVLSCNELDETP